MEKWRKNFGAIRQVRQVRQEENYETMGFGCILQGGGRAVHANRGVSEVRTSRGAEGEDGPA